MDKTIIQQAIKEEIAKTISGGEVLTEDLGVISGLVVASLGAIYIASRNAILNMRKDNAYKMFLQEHDKTDIINKRVPNLLKRFKLVNSLSDLSTMEKEAESVKAEINRLIGMVDNFIDDVVEKQKIPITKFVMSTPEKQKKLLKSYLVELYKAFEKDFEKAVEEKTSQLLA